MNIKVIIIALAYIFSTTELIAKASEANKYYIQLNSGHARGLAPKDDFGEESMKDSAIYGAELGYKISNRFHASFSIDHRPGFFNKDTEIYYHRGLRITEISYIKVKSLVTIANIHYNIAELGKFVPYLTVGVGVAINRTSPLLLRPFTPKGRSIISKVTRANRTNFAYKVGVGTRISISKNIDLDLRYQFSDFGKFQTGNHCKGYYENGSYIGEDVAPKLKGKLRAHEVLFGIAYKF